MFLAKNPSERISDLIVEVGITKREVQRIIVELANEGYLGHISKGGYKVFPREPLRLAV